MKRSIIKYKYKNIEENKEKAKVKRNEGIDRKRVGNSKRKLRIESNVFKCSLHKGSKEVMRFIGPYNVFPRHREVKKRARDPRGKYHENFQETTTNQRRLTKEGITRWFHKLR
jgi:hypothetical protein